MERNSSFPARLGFLAAVGALALTGACVSGTLGDGSRANGSGSSPGATDPQSTAGTGQGSGGQQSTAGSGASLGPVPIGLPVERACSAPGSAGPRSLRRLTAREFAASIADLFGDKSAPVAQVFNDLQVLGFTVDSSRLLVEGLNADQLMTNAEAVASWAVSTQLPQLTAICSTGGVTCTGGVDCHDAKCAKLFVQTFGRKAFRTAIPDSDPRIAAYSNLFMAEANFSDGVSSVISAMLQSPYFLYRSELGAEGATGSSIRLTPYEVASSLSYLLTGSSPDETLLKAADAAGSDDAALARMADEQATRLLGPSGEDALAPAAQDALMNFMNGWLGLGRLYTNVKDDTVQKLTDDQRADMATETKKFILDVFGGTTNNTVGDLFSANYTFLNQNLANYYKLSTDGLSNSFSKVTLPSGRDSGILGQATILVGYARSNLSSPTQRGHLVRSRLLCQAVPPPPDGLDVKFTPNTNFKTTREQYLQGHAAPDHQPCYGCHRIMDPIGVSFEHYDSFGNYRTTENGVTIDSTGTIYSANATDGDVDIDGLSGPKGLQTYLAKSDDLKTCLVRYWSYYAFGSVGWDQDACTYDAIRTEAAGKAFSMKSVLTAIVHAPRFTSRVNDQ